MYIPCTGRLSSDKGSNPLGIFDGTGFGVRIGKGIRLLFDFRGSVLEFSTHVQLRLVFDLGLCSVHVRFRFVFDFSLCSVPVRGRFRFVLDLG